MHECLKMLRFRGGGVLRTCCALMLLLNFSTHLKAQTKVSDVPKLVQDLRDKDPAVRGAAAAALDSLHDTAAEPALIAGLKQSAANVSAATVLVHTLGRFKDAKAVAAIAELLPTGAGHVAAQQLLQMGPLGSQAAADATGSVDKATWAAVQDSFLDAPDVALEVLPGALKNPKAAEQRALIVGLLADCAMQNPYYDNPPRAVFVETFLQVASDADPGVRVAVAAAIKQLAEMEKLNDPGLDHPDFGLQQTLPVLTNYARDQDTDVRTAAMATLGAMANVEAIAIIKKHLNDPDEGVKQSAANALAAAQAAAPEEAGNADAPKRGARSAVASKSAEARKLAQIKKWNGEAAIPQLIPLLGDASSLVRAAAADKLGQLDYRATAMNGADHEQNLSEVPGLIAALRDPHALVRAASAEALGEIGDNSAVTPLVTLLKDEKAKVVVAAAGALCSMVKGGGFARDALSAEDHQAVSSVLADLLSSSAEEVRHAAVSALVDVGTLDEMNKVVPLLEDSDVVMRNAAAQALARAFYPNPNVARDPRLDGLEKAAGPGLVKELSVQETRNGALSALSAMQRPPAEAAGPLMEGLKYDVWIHADGMVRPEIPFTEPFKGFQGPMAIGLAIDLLSRTGNPEAEPLLVKFLNIINPEAGKHACAGLATLGDARAVGPLLEVVQRPGVDLQPEAAQALGAFQDPRIVPVLLQALQSDNRSLRQAAAGALGHFHDARVVPALVHSLTDEDPDVRRAVAKALGELGDSSAAEPLGRVVKTKLRSGERAGEDKISGQRDGVSERDAGQTGSEPAGGASF